MTRTTLILSIASMSCLLLSARVHSQETSSRSQLIDAETDVSMRELELKMSELAVDEATVELDKIKLHLEAAQEVADPREVGRAKLELKRAAIRVEMLRVQSEMVRLQVERARAALEQGSGARAEKPGDRSHVKLEYVDDSDVVVVRGKKGDVEKTKARFEGEMIRSPPAPSSLDIKIFSIANGDAQDLASELKDLFPVDAASPIYAACDSRTNSVIVRGTPTELAVVEAVLLKLDGE